MVERIMLMSAFVVVIGVFGWFGGLDWNGMELGL